MVDSNYDFYRPKTETSKTKKDSTFSGASKTNNVSIFSEQTELSSLDDFTRRSAKARSTESGARAMQFVARDNKADGTTTSTESEDKAMQAVARDNKADEVTTTNGASTSDDATELEPYLKWKQTHKKIRFPESGKPLDVRDTALGYLYGDDVKQPNQDKKIAIIDVFSGVPDSPNHGDEVASFIHSVQQTEGNDVVFGIDCFESSEGDSKAMEYILSHPEEYSAVNISYGNDMSYGVASAILGEEVTPDNLSEKIPNLETLRDKVTDFKTRYDEGKLSDSDVDNFMNAVCNYNSDTIESDSTSHSALPSVLDDILGTIDEDIKRNEYIKAMEEKGIDVYIAEGNYKGQFSLTGLGSKAENVGATQNSWLVAEQGGQVVQVNDGNTVEVKDGLLYYEGNPFSAPLGADGETNVHTLGNNSHCETTQISNFIGTQVQTPYGPHWDMDGNGTPDLPANGSIKGIARSASRTLGSSGNQVLFEVGTSFGTPRYLIQEQIRKAKDARQNQ